MTRTTFLGVTALAVAGTVACGRGGRIESVPGPVYLVTVENPMSHPMDVWYDDGIEMSALGQVAPDALREFVIAAPASDSVEIVARDEGRTHTVTRPAVLRRGAGVRVTLTP